MFVVKHNKQFKRDSQRLALLLLLHFLVFMAQCFRFGWRRCSPLNWALCCNAILHLYSLEGQFTFVLHRNVRVRP
ncbi:hypothetical protein CA164_23355 [Vibrio parahaemolyticus]|nr:hypothetical protein [Vibrio parahaemolyticus]OXD26677.1 hypothetical protein CA164_23355 [Vibrio parahaemolyticus]